MRIAELLDQGTNNRIVQKLQHDGYDVSMVATVTRKPEFATLAAAACPRGKE